MTLTELEMYERIDMIAYEFLKAHATDYGLEPEISKRKGSYSRSRRQPQKMDHSGGINYLAPTLIYTKKNKT